MLNKIQISNAYVIVFRRNKELPETQRTLVLCKKSCIQHLLFPKVEKNQVF